MRDLVSLCRGDAGEATGGRCLRSRGWRRADSAVQRATLPDTPRLSRKMGAVQQVQRQVRRGHEEEALARDRGEGQLSHSPPPLIPPDPFWALEAFYSDDSFYPDVFYSRLEVVNVQNHGPILSFIVRSRASPPPDLSLGIYRH